MLRMDENTPPTPDSELPDLYRREATRCRQQADIADTIEMRVMLLETAARFEQLAAEQEASQN
jgi:hypothetical protein